MVSCYGWFMRGSRILPQVTTWSPQLQTTLDDKWASLFLGTLAL